MINMSEVFEHLKILGVLHEATQEELVAAQHNLKKFIKEPHPFGFDLNEIAATPEGRAEAIDKSFSFLSNHYEEIQAQFLGLMTPTYEKPSPPPSHWVYNEIQGYISVK